jgi:tetratricopeptide (TPR) repeat protein
LAQAQQLAGRPERRETTLEAGRLAERIGDIDLLVDAVLAGSRESGQYVMNDTEYAQIVRAALARIGTTRSGERARLLCALAHATDTINWRERYDLSVEAIAIARQVGDDATLAATLNATGSYRDSDPIATRLADGELAVAAAGRTGNLLALGNAWLALVTPAVASADLELVRRCIAETGAVVERLPIPPLTWPLANAQAVERLLAGDDKGAEAAAERGLAISSGTNQEEAMAAYGATLIDIRNHQHRLDEIVDLIADVARANPGIPAVDVALAFILCEIGRLDAARQVYAPHAAAGFADIPVDQAWTSGVAICADIAATLEDRTSAPLLVALLEPISDLIAATSVSCQGATARPLARVEAMLGNYEDAERHFLVALDLHTRLDAPYWIALTQLDYAEMLLARAAPADATHAHDLIASALAIAQQFDFPGLAARALA